MKNMLKILLPVLALAAGADTSWANNDSYTRNVAIVIWNGAEVLDWTGPSEVFASAGSFAQNGDEPAFHVYTVSGTKEPITSQRFITVQPEYSIEDAPKPDIVVLPGGGTGSVRNDPAFLAWVKESARNAEVALSVCTGAFLLGEAGLLDGKEATTWYGALSGLEQRFPETTVHRGRRFVDNGRVITTAGVSAGIDGALHLVARLLGRAVADQTAEYMEYRWTPEPYVAQHYSLLNPALDEDGRRLQMAGLDVRAGNWASAVSGYKAYLAEHPGDARARFQLGAAYYGDEQYAPAAEAYVKASQEESLRRRACFNAACCYSLLNEVDPALEQLARAVDLGPGIRNSLLHDADLENVRKDPRFEELVSRAE